MARQSLFGSGTASTGDSVLDCTLGLAADAMLAAYTVGEAGRVVGLEANPNVAFIVRQGMQTYDTAELPLTACMRHIEVVQSEAVHYLKPYQTMCLMWSIWTRCLRRLLKRPIIFSH